MVGIVDRARLLSPAWVDPLARDLVDRTMSRIKRQSVIERLLRLCSTSPGMLDASTGRASGAEVADRWEPKAQQGI